jgi:hypothetical protein
MNSLDYTMLYSSYENIINLACTLYSSDNLTNWFTTLAAENEDLTLKHNTGIGDYNSLTTWVMQLKAQLMYTCTLTTNTTNPLPTSHKSQTDPKMFTREDHGKLRSFVAILYLYLIDCPREFPNEQLKLRYTFSRLEGAILKQMIYCIKDDHMNLENFEAL